MKPLPLFLLAFAVLGGWVVLDHLRTPSLQLETVRDLPPVVAPTQQAARPTSSIQPLLPSHINVNGATLDQLVELPGVGPKLAERIMQGRPYRNLQDLDRVKGIGPKLLQKLAPVVLF